MKLVSWNIQWARGCDRAVSVRRIADTIRAGGDADVICLQEVAVGHDALPGLSGEDQVAQFMAEFPQHSAVFAPGSDQPGEGGRRCQFGNLLLSRLPVRAAWRRLLPWPADPAVPSMQRAVAEATLEAPHGPLRVLTTHLEYYSPLQRMAQVEALRALSAEALSHVRAPSVVKDGNPAFLPPLRCCVAISIANRMRRRTADWWRLPTSRGLTGWICGAICTPVSHTRTRWGCTAPTGLTTPTAAISRSRRRRCCRG